MIRGRVKGESEREESERGESEGGSERGRMSGGGRVMLGNDEL